MEDRFIVALGNFDGVHIGHRKLIESAKAFAIKNGVSSAIFTFINDIDSVIGKSNGLIYTGEEKLSIIGQLGIDGMFCETFDNDFLSKSPIEFLEYLDKYNVCGYVVGSDYHFGKNASGNIDILKEYAKTHNKQLIIEDFALYKKEKVSSTRIKNCLTNGNIEDANNMLFSPYFITGIVVNDRSVGSKIGYPTANILLPNEKLKMKYGVYKGRVVIDNKTYACAVNYGGRPTFSIDNLSIETHIIGFNDDLYGETLKVELLEYIRPIKKFNKVELLQKQIEKDIKRCL